MYAKRYENPTMLSRVTAKNVGDVFLRHTVDHFEGLHKCFHQLYYMYLSLCCFVHFAFEQIIQTKESE